MLRRTLALLLLALAAPPSAAQSPPGGEGPFFVYLGSFSSKSAAQAQARVLGGWVLRTDLYRGLTPGFFAVVHGPFGRRAEADSVLAQARRVQPDALVRSAGPPVLPPALGDPALLSAVLGDMTVAVSDSLSASNPCAPTEAHLTVLVGFANPIAGDRDVPATGFWLIERTGEVLPIRVCGE